jgi:glycerol-3-phosphate acyltransferase PlsY
MDLRLLGFALAYLIGSFPTGVVLTRRKFGIDVREMGSGNIGATNVTRVFGWWAGVLVFAIDFFKGAIPVWLAQTYYPDDKWLIAAVGFGVVLGHCFSVFLKLRGGKGVATSFGCMAVLTPLGAGIAGFVYLTVLATTRISAMGSLAGLLTVLIYISIIRPAVPFIVLTLAIGFVVIWRHKPNIARLWSDLKKK